MADIVIGKISYKRAVATGFGIINKTSNARSATLCGNVENRGSRSIPELDLTQHARWRSYETRNWFGAITAAINELDLATRNRIRNGLYATVSRGLTKNGFVACVHADEIGKRSIGIWSEY
ncbi:unannotated protein [freshwater metagenome]|uniref:Unannotated protein n=1 Tax=freshwater metagenome TaxID=449393 RepID=A0A6J6DNN0_9ZZZZ